MKMFFAPGAHIQGFLWGTNLEVELLGNRVYTFATLLGKASLWKWLYLFLLPPGWLNQYLVLSTKNFANLVGT